MSIKIVLEELNDYLILVTYTNVMTSLIANLIKENTLSSPNLIRAFQHIARVDFVPREYKHLSSDDAPLPIGHNQTISQPSTVAFMLEQLAVQLGDNILDVGTGSGWTTALLAELTGETGKVYGVERIPSLKAFGEKNINRYQFISHKRVKIYLRNGHEGLLEFAPYDRILVSAAADTVPQKLLEQLAIGGRLVMPVGEPGSTKDMVVVNRLTVDNYTQDFFPGFNFVPLVKNNLF